MNQSSSPLFTKIVVGVCFGLGIIGIAVFAGSTFSSGDAEDPLQGDVVIWGTLQESEMKKIFNEYSQISKKITVKYTEVPESLLNDKFIESVAKDTAPDLIIAGENSLFPLRNYFLLYPPELMSEKSYKDTFARSTYKFYGDSGVFAFPVAIDPMIMYVNQDILQNTGMSRPPQTWLDIPIFVKQVIDLNKNNKISEQRALAMGSFSNVLYAKETILSLLLQLNNEVITRSFETKDENGKLTYTEKFEAVFGIKDARRNLDNQSNSESVFTFFGSFMNPNYENAYTWSKRAPIDRDLFAAGNLGLLFALASDKKYIDAKNPNLRYELATMPIPEKDSTDYLNTQYAKVYAVGITSKAKNVPLAQKMVTDITSQEISGKISSGYGLAPARNDVLLKEQSNPDLDVIYRSAERGTFVLEPKSNLFYTIFMQISEAINGSRLTPVEIVNNAQQELVRQIAP